MNKLLETIENGFEHSILYATVSFALQKAGFIQKTAQTSAAIALSLISITTICFFLFFVAMGIALWIGGMVKSTLLGFLFTAVLFVTIAVAIVLYSKRGVIPFLRNKIVSIINKK